MLKFEIACLNKVCRCRFSRIKSNDAKVENMALMTCTCLRWHTPVFYDTFKNIFTRIICNISKQLRFSIKIKELLFSWGRWAFDIEHQLERDGNSEIWKGNDIIIERNYNFFNILNHFWTLLPRTKYSWHSLKNRENIKGALSPLPKLWWYQNRPGKVGLTLIEMGFFKSSVMEGGGEYKGPTIITLLLLLQWS